jgi:hypothetical protein
LSTTAPSYIVQIVLHLMSNGSHGVTLFVPITTSRRADLSLRALGFVKLNMRRALGRNCVCVW